MRHPGQFVVLRVRTVILAAISLIVVVAPLHVAWATIAPCDNTAHHEGSILRHPDRPSLLTPRDLRSNRQLSDQLHAKRLSPESIRHCIESNTRIVNHVVDFDEYIQVLHNYVTALEQTPRGHEPYGSEIADSIIWSFGETAVVDLRSLAASHQGRRVLTGTTVPKPTNTQIHWQNVTVGPKVTARSAVFERSVSFIRARFPWVAYFDHSTFRDVVQFRQSTFAQHADFAGVRFENVALFHGNVFAGPVNFRRARFGDTAVFVDKFGGEVWFDGARFENQVQYEGTKFATKSNFTDVIFGGGAFFGSAQGPGNKPIFATFGGDVSFRGTKIRRPSRI